MTLSDVVFFSAALPYQGGTDHRNEQWLEFWAILFQRHGYVPYDFLRRPCWSNPAVEFWYSQNAIVFCATDRGQKTLPPEFLASGYPLSQPHPLTFLINVTRFRPLSAAALDAEWQDYQSLMRAYERGDGILPLLKTTGALDDSDKRLFPASRTLMTDANAEIASRDAEVTRLTHELEVFRAEAAALEHEVAALRNSLSWRLTETARRSLQWFSGSKANRKQ